jgi:ERCC4-type nuclease
MDISMIRVYCDHREAKVLEHASKWLANYKDIEVCRTQADKGDYTICDVKSVLQPPPLAGIPCTPIYKLIETPLAVIERKSLLDQAASIIDGRHHDNKAKLLKFCAEHNAKPYYLVEGFPQRGAQYGQIFGHQLINSFMHMMVRDGIQIIYSDTPEGSFRTVMDLAEAYRTHAPSAATAALIPAEEKQLNEVLPMQPCPQLLAASKKSDTEIVLKMMKAAHVTDSVAAAILEEYSIMGIALERPRLCDMQINGRKLGKRAAELQALTPATQQMILASSGGIGDETAGKLVAGCGGISHMTVEKLATIDVGHGRFGQKKAERLMALLNVGGDLRAPVAPTAPTPLQ